MNAFTGESTTSPLPMHGFNERVLDANWLDRLRAPIGHEAVRDLFGARSNSAPTQFDPFAQGNSPQFETLRASLSSRVGYISTPAGYCASKQISEAHERMLGIYVTSIYFRARGDSTRAVLAFKRRSAAWNAWFEKLETFHTLGNGWNGYTAEAPSESSIQIARLLLQVAEDSNYCPSRLSPSAMGGIAITWKAAGRKVLVEVYNDGRVFALSSVHRGDMDVRQVETSSIHLQKFLMEIREFLDD